MSAHTHTDITNEAATGLLSALFCEVNGPETLAMVRASKLTAEKLPAPQDGQIFDRMIAKLDIGLRGESLRASIVASDPICWTRIQTLTAVQNKKSPIESVQKYIQVLMQTEKISAEANVIPELVDEIKQQDQSFDKIGNQTLILPATFSQDTEPLISAGYNTDSDASLRYAEECKHCLRFCSGLGWLYWDQRRWIPHSDSKAVSLAKKSARKWLMGAVQSTDSHRESLIRSASILESAGHIKGAVDLARSDERLIIPVSTLDSDKWKLNVVNGTIDLTAGKLNPHNRDDFITKIAPVEYDQNAQHEILNRYLNTLDAATPGMSAFLARCFGAALTGDASPETLFILQGDGGSGKTTLVESMAAMLGDYAVKLPFQSFCQSKHGRGPGSASPDLIPLRGTRLAYASEGDQSARLDSGVIKMLTGNEPIAARALYSAPIIFPQTFKLWLVSNYDPKASSDDTGMWRRMMKIPFAVIPENLRDPEVKKMLTNDPEVRSALLSWAVKGCLDWQERGGGRIGLAQPEAIKAATEAYHIKQDSLAEWWDDLLSSDARLDPLQYAFARDLHKNYNNWCPLNGIPPVHGKRFAQYLESKGLQWKRRTGGVRTWNGIKMIN